VATSFEKWLALLAVIGEAIVAVVLPELSRDVAAIVVQLLLPCW
jgi:hypothetical protein